MFHFFDLHSSELLFDVPGLALKKLIVTKSTSQDP